MLRQQLYRWTAFTAFVCAAFAWVPPFLDRAGLAAVGFGFLALSLGRAWGVARPGVPAPLGPAFTFPPTTAQVGNGALADRIGAYTADEEY